MVICKMGCWSFVKKCRGGEEISVPLTMITCPSPLVSYNILEKARDVLRWDVWREVNGMSGGGCPEVWWDVDPPPPQNYVCALMMHTTVGAGLIRSALK